MPLGRSEDVQCLKVREQRRRDARHTAAGALRRDWLDCLASSLCNEGSGPNGRNGRDPAVDQEVCPDHVRRLVGSPAAKIKQWLAFAQCPIRVAQGIGNVLWPMTFRRREA